MAASVTGSKTCTQALAPHLTAPYLTTLLATPIESMTVGQIRDLVDALKRVAGGEARNIVVGTLLK